VTEFATSVAYFGPAGTFTEEALLSQADYAAAQRVPLPTIPDVLDSVERSTHRLGFVPIENGIEGSVPITLDGLVFDFDLLIQREVVLDIHLALLANHGAELSNIRSVLSFPHALAQCRKYLAEHLPSASPVSAPSTAEAARMLGENPDASMAAIAPVSAATRYDLAVIARQIEDHPENQTRFVSLAKSGIPQPTGHDRTSIVCFQGSDHPGSLHSILGQFAARDINLTKLESRPTKRGLGDYCFVIDLEGHVGDELVADCLRELHASLANVKFLGSYPAAGAHGPAKRREAEIAWRSADGWIRSLQSQIDGRRAL
jgi:prephenate dehydratase